MARVGSSPDAGGHGEKSPGESPARHGSRPRLPAAVAFAPAGVPASLPGGSEQLSSPSRRTKIVVEAAQSVLVVDADPARRDAICREIESGIPGARLLVAGSLDECRKILAAGPPDIALLGTGLPDGDPLEILSNPAEDGVCPFVVVAPEGAGRLAVGAMKAGAIDFVEISAGATAGLPRVIENALRDWALRVELRRSREDRKKNEELLARSEERFRLAMGAVRDVLWDWDLRSERTYFSPASVEILDFEPGDGMRASGTWNDRIHPDDRGPALAAVRDCVEGRIEGYATEIRVRMNDGSWKWVLTRGSAVERDESGRATRILGTHTDIGERKRVEEALSRSEERFRLAMSAAREALWDWDVNENRVYLSPASAEVLGFDPDEITDVPGAWRDRMPPEDLARGLELVRECVEGKTERYQVEYRVRRKDGEWKWIHERGSAVARDQDGRATRMVGTRTDVTERRKFQEEREALREQVVEAQKLESLGRLAGGVAHDFNNILLGIIGNAEVALLDIPADSPARSCLDDILSASERAARLAKQMLAYSGRGRFEVRPIDLVVAVAGMTRLLEAAIPKKTRLRTEPGRSLPPVRADLSQVEQVVMNLVINASESLDPERGGEVVVRTGVGEFGPGELAASRLPEKPPPGRFVFLEVSDDGAGMDEVAREKLFDPFFSTKFVGRGLGLSAVLGIVRGHGGAIFVDSTPGRGTTMRVLLPVGPDEREPCDLETGPAAQRPEWRGAGRILLVDDEETIRKAASRLVSSLGFDVTPVPDGQGALDAIESAGDRFACVLLDLSMPGLGGNEVVKRIRAAGSRVPVILMSGFSEDELRDRYAGVGITAFLQKPFDRQTLAAALRETIGSDTTS